MKVSIGTEASIFPACLSLLCWVILVGAITEVVQAFNIDVFPFCAEILSLQDQPFTLLSLLPVQYDMSESTLLGRTLWLSVWGRSLFGTDQFLGEVLVALKKFDLSTCTKRWYLLKERVSDGEGQRDRWTPLDS